MQITREQLAGYIDHTLLKPEATPAEVHALAAEGRRLGVAALCVSPSMLDPQLLEGPLELGAVKLAAVCGFPSGKHVAAVKADEAARAVAAGACEVDMVIDVGLVKAGRIDLTETEIRSVREAVPGAVLKVIIESAVLSDAEIVAACHAAENARADFVKTSTGFHPSGGASVEAVRLMAQTVGGRLGVKASGGIRDCDTALAMIEAGATRLGCSATQNILAGLAGPEA